MVKLEYEGKQYRSREGETVLQTFMRHGVTVPFSCGNGACHVCMQRSESGDVPVAAQKGLRETLRERGYFLLCKCVPQNDMQIAPPRDTDLLHRAVVYKKELLAPDVCRLLLEPATQLHYHAGQFINLHNDDGVVRSYSLASVPREDYFLEIHVKRTPGGILSNWIFDELSENTELEFQAPTGNNYYADGDPGQPLLLVGTGTGLSPLLGIARDALTSGHKGPIHLYHGSRHPQGLYLQSLLKDLSEQYSNFHPVSCVSGQEIEEGYRAGRANDVALLDHPKLQGWRIYLCGQPEMVAVTTQAAEAAGADPQEIYADPFTDLATTAAEGVNEADAEDLSAAEAESAEHIQNAERRKYPEPDLELWKCLGEGRILIEVLTDFYTRVYEDPLLSPFFARVTRQRAIEKQYNFMCQVLTGQNVYFGERPRNAHHWMVISNEMFDYRENLFGECLRRFDVPEYAIRRLRATNEIYREDIVKDKPWKKILFGKEVPVEGFDEITLDDATLCDSCGQEISVGSRVQYHVRLGKVYCEMCQQDCHE